MELTNSQKKKLIENNMAILKEVSIIGKETSKILKVNGMIDEDIQDYPQSVKGKFTLKRRRELAEVNRLLRAIVSTNPIDIQKAFTKIKKLLLSNEKIFKKL